jgi:retron-type reverse transcriptase
MATVLDKISSFDNLLKSERKIACGKRKKKPVARFEQDLGYNISKLSDELKSGKYRVSKYHSFKVYEPKERNIQALRFRDRIVQNCICEQILRPWLEPRLIYDNAACRVGKGTHFAMRRLTAFLADFYKHNGVDGYALKIDVRKYFDNIDHKVLKKRLQRFPTSGGVRLLCGIVDSYNADTGKGLPLGNQSSQWFALYYLDSLDRLIKEKFRIKYYTRYMDDMVLVHHDREYLRSVLRELRAFARDELKLEFNDKTQIAPLSQGIDYLGFRFYLGRNGKVVRRLRGTAKTRLKRNLKRLKIAYANGGMDWDDVKTRLQCYRAHLSHGHTFRLLGNALHKVKFVKGRG